MDRRWRHAAFPCGLLYRIQFYPLVLCIIAVILTSAPARTTCRDYYSLNADDWYYLKPNDTNTTKGSLVDKFLQGFVGGGNGDTTTTHAPTTTTSTEALNNLSIASPCTRYNVKCSIATWGLFDQRLRVLGIVFFIQLLSVLVSAGMLLLRYVRKLSPKLAFASLFSILFGLANLAAMLLEIYVTNRYKFVNIATVEPRHNRNGIIAITIDYEQWIGALLMSLCASAFYFLDCALLRHYYYSKTPPQNTPQRPMFNTPGHIKAHGSGGEVRMYTNGDAKYNHKAYSNDSLNNGIMHGIDPSFSYKTNGNVLNATDSVAPLYVSAETSFDAMSDHSGSSHDAPVVAYGHGPLRGSNRVEPLQDDGPIVVVPVSGELNSGYVDDEMSVRERKVHAPHPIISD